MNTSRRPAVRTSIGRIAVSGAAAMATVLAAAPMASADDLTTDDSGTTEAPAEPTTIEETGTESGTDETGPEESGTESGDAPVAEQSAKGSSSTSAAESADEAEVAADEPEPNFGLQKFRVGVRIADGVDAPAGTSTVGSTITIVITDQDDNEDEVTCATEESTVDDEGDDPTASFCVFDEFEELALPDDLSDEARRAVERAEVSDDEDFAPEQYFAGSAGETYTITQTGAVDGLELDPDVVVIEPCEATFGPFCGDISLGEEKSPFLTTKVVFEDTLPVDEPDTDAGVDDNGAEDEDGVLPDTGGSNSALLGYAALMMAGGGWLVTRGRRRTSDVGIG